MAAFKITSFAGVAPKLSARLLANDVGQEAKDVNLDAGVLTPVKDNSNVQQITDGRTSAYKYDFSGSTYYLQFTNDVNVVPGPVPDDAFDRLYWTGNTFPQMASSTEIITAGGSGDYPRNFFRLGIPAPANAPTTSITSGSDDGTQTQFSTSYVYTFVSAFGEEGPPSPASTVLTKVDAQTVTISGMDTSTSKSNTNLSKKRIYRSNTGSNTTNFQFVKEVTLATASTTDNTTNANLAEIIPSTFHIAPPDEDTSTYPNGKMIGLTAMPNGVLAGFTGKRLCFSEPFLPHAWPVAFRITLEEEIVAIAMTGSGLFVGTKGTPYFVAGTDPQSMSIIRLEAAQACLNKRSMVDMGDYVIYASPDGLVLVEGTSVGVITEPIIDPETWRGSYYPDTIQGFLHEGKYIGYFNSGGNRGGFIFDPRGGKNAFTNLTATSTTIPTGGYTDPDNNELYVIVDNGSTTNIERYQNGSNNQTLTFKTKEIVMPKLTSMAFVKVEAESFASPGITVKVFGDGTEIYDATITTSGSVFSVTGAAPTSFSATSISEPILRLPASKHKTFAVEVSGAQVVNEIAIAESMEELRSI